MEDHVAVPARLLAEQIVSEVANDEFDMFPAASRRYFADPKWMSRTNRGDGLLEFEGGLVVALVTPIALVAATRVVEYAVDLLLQRGLPAAGRTVKRLLRLSDSDNVLDRSDDTDTSHDEALSLTEEQWEEVRRIVMDVAERGGLSLDQAHLVADAVVGRGRLAK